MKTKRYFNQILKPYKNIIKELTGSYTDINVVIGSNFCCYCREDYDKEIEIPLFEDTMGRVTFHNKMKRKLKEYGIDDEFSCEILSFLHEVGHIYTYNKWADFKYTIGTRLIEKIQPLFKNSYKMTNFFFNLYYSFKLESNADHWAMDYIKYHKEQVHKWEYAIAKNYNYVLPKMIEKEIVKI